MQKKVGSFAEGPHPGGARKEDSGLIDLDALMRQAAESERDVSRAAAATPPSSQHAPRVPTLAPPVMTPAPGAVRPLSAPAVAAKAIAAPAVAARAVATKPVREPDESLTGMSTGPASTRSFAKPARSSRPGYAVAGGVAVAVLLCASVVGYGISRPSASPAAATASTAARVETAAKATPHGPVEAQPATPAAPEIGANDLPPAASPADERGAARNVPAGHGTAGAARARNDQPAPRVDPKVTALVLPDSPTRDPSDLGAAMRGAVGANAQTVDPATVAGPASSARTLRPSMGAVVGAINGVLPGARACLGEDDPITHASVTFKSDGAVSRVDISGDRPTSGCVRAALSKARIEPFADDTFATRVTVRP
ncbi:MAG: Fe-S oxidoreductase [Labilithrix sp.]|nr:Fe-S oxidoreductase [Labilithrix sp.]